MKIRNITNLLVLACLSLCTIGIYAADDWAQFSRYKDANKLLISQQSESIPAVVFMGNSITQGWAEFDPDFFIDNNFVGRGISGQTSYQMLTRFREDVINLHPQIVVINAGTNDIAENNHNYDEDITFGNIVSMAELAKANGISVILTSVLPAVQFPWNPSIQDIEEKVASLNKKIQTYAKTNNIPYADYFEGMADNDKAMKPGLSYDGVHPTLEGYKIMEDVILSQITEKLSRDNP